MKNERTLAIWMDYSKAFLIEFTDKAREIDTVEVQPVKNTYGNGLHSYHEDQKRKENRHAFFKKITQKAQNYSRVILFGPSSAKVELSHQWHKDGLFTDQGLEVITTGRLTETQRCHWVNNHFIPPVVAP